MINDSKGCGGVMRIAPLGLLPDVLDATAAFELWARAAAITHTHPAGYLAAGALAALIRELVAGRGLVEAAETAINIARDWPGHQATVAAMKVALDLAAEDHCDRTRAVTSLGQGWIAEEALAVVSASTRLRSRATGPRRPEALRIAANHDGDSDSTASIAGQIFGAWRGAQTLPHDWVAGLDVLVPALDEMRRLLGYR